MPANVEIKAKVKNFPTFLEKARELTGEDGTLLCQTDTFFNCQNGRLKLRCFKNENSGQLIFYQRPDRTGPKVSTFSVVPTDKPAELKETLSSAYGVKGEVRKRRTLFLVGQTRVHADEVEGLGTFMELEVQLKEGQSAAEGNRIAEDLMSKLGVLGADLITGAYMDLILKANQNSFTGPNTMSAMSNSSRNDALELPGFYYDPEKKRYFRVLPGTNNHNPLTQEKIVAKKAKLDTCTTQTGRIIRKNSADLLYRRSIGQCGHCLQSNFVTEMTEVKLRTCAIKEDPYSSPHLVSSMHPTMDFSETMLYYWHNGDRQDVWRLGQKHMLFIPHCSSVCMLNFDQKGVLGASAGHSQMIWWDCERSHGNSKKIVSGQTPFSCAAPMNPNSKYVASFGNGNKAIFVTNLESFFSSPAFHVRGGPGYSVVRLKKDILAQCFSYDPNIHFNGVRGGTVVGLDRRLPPKGSYCCSMKTSAMNPNVRQLRALSDEFSLIVGHQNTTETPSMFLWDIRFQAKPVLQYSTTVENICSSAMEPKVNFTINIDRDERIITTVLPGSDFSARLWSIKTGEVITKYPKEITRNTERVTAAAYTNDWDGVRIAVFEEGIKLLSFR